MADGQGLGLALTGARRASPAAWGSTPPPQFVKGYTRSYIICPPEQAFGRKYLSLPMGVARSSVLTIPTWELCKNVLDRCY